MTDLSAYDRPDLTLSCHYCSGHGQLPTADAVAVGQPWVRWGRDCPICKGSGDLPCSQIGKPNCTGYAAYSIALGADDDLCTYHFNHCPQCGDRWIVIGDSVLCPTCDATALRNVPTPELLAAARR